VRLVSGAALVFACAGKSISHGDDSSADDGYGNGGFANAGYGGKGGNINTGGKGGSPGKGGSSGKGGSPGQGGGPTTGGVGGTSGRGGTGNVGGDPGPAGAGGCGGRNVGSVYGTCAAPDQCISMRTPVSEYVRRNGNLTRPSSGDGGQGGEGGDSGEPSTNMATAWICRTEAVREGFLTFEYYMPEEGTQVPGFTLTTGDAPCQGSVIATGTLSEFAPPPRGWWSTQCIAVNDVELGPVVTVVVPRVNPPYPAVRNLRFVTGCECLRQVLRFDECGDYLSPQECF
jgi:hypothetical protein